MTGMGVKKRQIGQNNEKVYKFSVEEGIEVDGGSESEEDDVGQRVTCCGFTIYKKDIESLNGWLTDTVVNCMLR